MPFGFFLVPLVAVKEIDCIPLLYADDIFVHL